MEVRGNLLKDWRRHRFVKFMRSTCRHLMGSWFTHGEPPWFTPKISSFDWVIHLFRGKCSEKFIGFSFDLEEMFTWFHTDQTKRWIVGSDSVPKVGVFPRNRSRGSYYQGCKDFAANDIFADVSLGSLISWYRVCGGHFLVQHNFHSQNSSRDDVIADTNQCGW